MSRQVCALGIAAITAFAAACDGTLAGMHDTRGTLPVVYPEPA